MLRTLIVLEPSPLSLAASGANVGNGVAMARVVGAGGLFGSAMCSSLATKNVDYQPVTDLAWSDLDQLAQAFDRLASDIANDPERRPWMMFWCAGVGHVGADDEVHQRDQQTLGLLLNALASVPADRSGVFVLASSAGAVYSGNTTWPATEQTEPVPLHAYGESKLAQEQRVSSFANSHPHVRAVHLRISNLYGTGQEIDKPQGLLSHLVANTFRRVPSTIFVPLDTSRDYLFTEDAAAMAIRAALLGLSSDPGTIDTRILAAERNFTIAQILGILGKIVKRRIPTIAQTTANTNRQPPMLSFRSQDHEQRDLAKVSLEEGISRLVAEYAHA